MNTNVFFTNRLYFCVTAVWLFMTAAHLSAAQADTLAAAPTENKRPAYANKREERTARIMRRWNKLVPTYSKLQYAGNMGLLSVGMGWDYGKREQWETDVLLGFLPKYNSSRNKLTMTLKQNFTPWDIGLTDELSLSPLSCGLYFNTIFGQEFWVSEPERYPKGYYGFASKVRFHIFIGQRLNLKLSPDKEANLITLFYELSTCDLYAVSAFTNSYLKPKDYLSLSFGLKIKWL